MPFKNEHTIDNIDTVEQENFKIDEERKYVRFDSNKFSEVKRHDKGFLTAWGTMARVGIQEYMTSDGRISKELRLPEEVFNKDSLESFNNIPVTDGHPRVIVNSKNAIKYQKGLTGEYTQKKDDSYTMNKMTIVDEDLLKKVSNGKVELSAGYECDLDKTPGVHPVYGRYDAIQRNIRGNHIAVVDRARAGHSARLHLDSADDNVAVIINQNEAGMETLKLDEKEFEVSKEVCDAVNEALSKAKKEKDEAKNANDKLSKEMEELKKSKKDSKEDSQNEALENLQAKFDALEKSIPAKAKEYSKVLEVAKSVMDEEAFSKCDSMDSFAIKQEVVKSHYKLDEEKSEAYIEARFDILCEELAKSKEDEAELGKALVNTSTLKEDSIEELRAKKISETKNKWK